MSRPPLPSMARALGYAGLLPQAAAALLLAGGSLEYRFAALALAFAYAALIFSFLGALWWGLAAAQPEAAPEWVWVAGVVPALIALATCIPWAIGADWPQPSLIILALGVSVSVMVDRRLDKLGLCPTGWLRLRIHLSVALGALTAWCAVS